MFEEIVKPLGWIEYIPTLIGLVLGVMCAFTFVSSLWRSYGHS